MTLTFNEYELEKIIRNSEVFDEFYAIVKRQMDSDEAKEYWDEFWLNYRDEQVENEVMDEL